MKYFIALTLVFSLVFLGFGTQLVNAYGVYNETRPGNIYQMSNSKLTYQPISRDFLTKAQDFNDNIYTYEIDPINSKRITFRQLAEGDHNLIYLERQQLAQLEILLNEYQAKKYQIVNNINANKGEFRRVMLANGAVREDKLQNNNLAEINKEINRLRDEYFEKMQAVLTSEQINTIATNDYMVDIGEQEIEPAQNEVSISSYPVKGKNTTIICSTGINQEQQCGVSYLQRGVN